MDTTTDRSALEGKLIPELQQIAQRLGIEGSQKLRKAGLIDAIVEHAGGDGRTVERPGRSGERIRRRHDRHVRDRVRRACTSHRRRIERPAVRERRRRSTKASEMPGTTGRGPRRTEANASPEIVSRTTASRTTARRATGRATTGPRATAKAATVLRAGRRAIVRRATDHAATVPKATDPAVTIKVDGPTVATEARERAVTAAGVRHAKSAGGSARNAVSARSRSGPRSSRTRRS